MAGAGTQSTLEEWLTWSFSPAVSAVLVTLVIGLTLPVLIHWYLYRKAVSKELPSFLLLGPSNSGKTSLLTLLTNGTASTTHTSQTSQTALCSLPASVRAFEDRYRSENDPGAHAGQRPSFQLVDTPGHGKLRHHALTSLTSPGALRGLLFVVDSAALSSAAGLSEAGAYLHDVLLLLQRRQTQARTSKAPAPVPVLVAANKQDVFTSLPETLVATKLEEEIGRVRVTKAKSLMDSGVGMEADAGGSSEDEEGGWLGEFGSKAFRFAQMEEHGVDVQIVGGNVVGANGENGQVDAWWRWIGEAL